MFGDANDNSETDDQKRHQKPNDSMRLYETLTQQEDWRTSQKTKLLKSMLHVRIKKKRRNFQSET